MAPATEAEPSSSQLDEAEIPVAIVGIGASAGGLAAMEEFFGALPTDGSTDAVGFVVVQHLDPDHESLLLDLVKRYTHLEIEWAQDGMPVRAGHAYLMPRGSEMTLDGGRLHVGRLAPPHGLRLPIDHFFKSLAADMGERTVAIVLSGTGTDGTVGAREVKRAGGIVMAQLPDSAGYDGMPTSVIEAGLADYVLAPQNMVRELLGGPTLESGSTLSPQPESEAADVLSGVMAALRDQTGHDFSHYKSNTILRRVERRMGLARVERMTDYLALLRRDPAEVETLFRELLIGVTSFFRDKEAFESLQERVIRPLLASKKSGDTIRVWIPGCSTGEEAYSIAILLDEAIAEAKHRITAQVFATDIDQEAIDRARTGIYPDSIAVEVSSERLDRYFTTASGGLRVAESVRGTIVFAKQDMTKDPPFSQVDLISCRNLLIYLDGALQKRLMPLYYYALNPGGYLFLGSSETIGDAHRTFTTIDKKWKIYQRRSTIEPQSVPELSEMPSRDARVGRPKNSDRQSAQREPLSAAAQRAVLDRHSPAAVVINGGGDVLYIQGHTGKYLEPARGEDTNNIFKMAREGLRFELAAGVRKAFTEQASVRYDRLRVKSDDTVVTINLGIEPLVRAGEVESSLLVVFEELAVQPAAPDETVQVPADDAQQRIADLDRELSAKEEYLRAMVEELETSNEELKATNEELQSANEELQSTIEELETSKEELQSVNEELITVNGELTQKIEQLSQASNDMNNLLASTGIGTLFVDRQLRIQRFTPAITDIIKLIQADAGRPLSDIAVLLRGKPDLAGLVEGVLETLVSTQFEVEVEDGRAFQMRIQPYRTLDNVIEGAVLSFVDSSEQRDLRRELVRLACVAQQAQEYAESIVDSVKDPLLVVDGALNVISVNSAFYSAFEVVPGSIAGKPIGEIERGPWSQDILKELLMQILPEKGEVEDLPVSYSSPEGKQSFAVSARELTQSEDKERRLIVLTAKEALKS